MNQTPRCCKRVGRSVGSMAMNVPVPCVAFKVASRCVNTPDTELCTAESQLKPMIGALESIVAVLECSLVVAPLGKQSGEYQRVDREGQQRRSRSKRTIGQARDVT